MRRLKNKTDHLEDLAILTTVILVAVFGFGCASPTTPEEPSCPGASPDGYWCVSATADAPQRPLRADAEVADAYWIAIQGCLGLSGRIRDYGLVEHRVCHALALPGSDFLCDHWPDGGYTWPDAIHVMEDPVVHVQSWKHEQMHVLLFKATGSYDSNHEFGGKIQGHPTGREWERCTTS